ncbi:MAG: lycopene cyclase domain-containing protein [Chitinophagales bacterium]|nr:lycopene cyclase domain-containing protein [Chitinophagales bacterium]
MPDKNYTYLLIDLLCIIVPLVASFHPRSPFYRQWKYYLPANLLVSALFLAWDAIFTDMGIWGFNPDYITGIKLYNLPIEEVLFFICIPYACTYTYYVFASYVKTSFPLLAALLSYVLAAALSVTALLYIDRLYSSVTFFLLSALLVGMARRSTLWLDRFFVVYAIMLVPFFISNGILTGSTLDIPIVWYNNAHNLNFRIFTIPLEDCFYAMLLLLLNIGGYEWIKERFAKQMTGSYDTHKNYTLKQVK